MFVNMYNVFMLMSDNDDLCNFVMSMIKKWLIFFWKTIDKDLCISNMAALLLWTRQDSEMKQQKHEYLHVTTIKKCFLL